MKKVTHKEQQEAWEKEHQKPHVLLQMDSEKASAGVELFLAWLKERGVETVGLKAVEMGCGKGRNCIWLAEQGLEATGFDFSNAAIEEAKRRAQVRGFAEKAKFVVQDATTKWQFDNESFDIAVDCFASTDIEGEENRAFAVSEFKRVLKPGGYLVVYTLSTEDGFHKEMVEKSPASEKNSFVHPTGKFEKVFDDEEIAEIYKDFKLVEKRRLKKEPVFFGKAYPSNHYWLVYQK